MKGFVKWLIAGGIILGSGLTMLITGLALNGWKWEITDEYEQKTFTSTQTADKLELHAAAGDVYVQFYDGDSVQISYPVGSRFYYGVKQDGSEIELTYSNAGFFGGWLFNFSGVPDTIISIPSGAKVDLDVELDAGRLFVDDGSYGEVELTVNAGTLKAGTISCTQADCKVNAGKLEIEKVISAYLEVEVNAGSAQLSGAECSQLEVEVSAGSAVIRSIAGCQNADIDVSAGGATLSFAESKDQFSIITDVSAGSCNVQPQIQATDRRISVRVSAGSANLEFVEAH